jgi:RNA polymerase sigma-70 factor (ECF subfamily)
MPCSAGSAGLRLGSGRWAKRDSRRRKIEFSTDIFNGSNPIQQAATRLHQSFREGNSIPALSSPSKDKERPGRTTVRRATNPGFNEAEAIEKAKSGDAYAFENLYGLHKRRVYSLCLRMTGNTAEAEDLTQEAFLQLYRKIATFRGESAFSTWLHRLSVNVVLMHLRKKGLPEVSLEETLEPQQEDGPKKDIGARDNVLAGSIDRVNLERAIENLPPGYRIIFVLHDIEGYEHNEIAEMMGCSIGNSKSQLHKARMKLRDLLKQSKAEKAARR